MRSARSALASHRLWASDIPRQPTLLAAERLHEVGDDVVDVLEADRDAHGAVVDPKLGALLGADAHVRRRGGMRDQALGIAEVVGDVDELQPVQPLARCPLARPAIEGYD